jgi:1A family penicillin-binding protein
MLKTIKKKVHHVKEHKKHWLVSIISLFLLCSSFFLLWIASFRLPDLDSFEGRVVSESTKIFDRTGEILLYDVHKDTKRTLVESQNISRYLKDATVAIEDADFYQHKGIKPTAILRAVLANLFSISYSQGGSTITQQVIKNTVLTQEKSISRKLKEWILALKLEKVKTKDQILTIYLNESPYGGSIYGIEEASRVFFGKNALDLTLGESAYLAALPNAPSRFSPYGNNRKLLDKRKSLVLQKMYENNFITKKQQGEADKEEVVFLANDNINLKAPHFVMYVKDWLENRYGVEAVESKGLRVITTLDYNLQKKAEEIVAKFSKDNLEKYNASNGAMVATDVKTGQILVMVGSKDYFSKDIDGNFNIATAFRQPGSSFKPFVYAASFEKGYTPETVLFDLKTEFSSACKPDGTPIKEEDADKCYSPENYDGKFRGPITLRDALAQSINIPAIKILYLTGLKKAIGLANDMGIESINDPDRYGLTLVLGGGEVSLLELTGAYSVFANNGVRNNIIPVLRVEDSNGKIIETFNEKTERRVLSEESALAITSILSDNNARSPSYGYNSPLHFPGYDVAAKTGTTNDYKDAWILGYTPHVALGAWVGNNDNTPMEKKVAGFIVAPMWNAFMQEVLKSYPAENFKNYYPDYDNSIRPALRGVWQGGESYFIDSRNGTIATDLTPEQYREEKVYPSVHSILYWLDKDNPRGERPAHPENDSQFYLWEEPIQKWLEANPVSIPNVNTPTVNPTPVVQPQNTIVLKPSMTITSPDQKTKYFIDSQIKISISILNFNAARVEYYLNGQFIGSSNTRPFDFSFSPKEFDGMTQYSNIRVVAHGFLGEKIEASTSFPISPKQ